MSRSIAAALVMLTLAFTACADDSTGSTSVPDPRDGTTSTDGGPVSDPSSLNHVPDAVDDPADAMGGFVWGPSDGDGQRCFSEAGHQPPNVLANDTDSDGDVLTLAIETTNFGGRIAGEEGIEQFGSGQTYVRIATDGEVVDFCVTRAAAVNLAGSARITYRVDDGVGGSDTAEIDFLLLCRATAGGPTVPCT